MNTFIIRFFFFYFLITLFPGVWGQKITLNGGKSSEILSNRHTSAKQVSREIMWVRIESGKFLMGSTQNEVEKIYQEARIRSSMLDKITFSAEMPQRWVELSSFEISKYEITNAQYHAFVIATGRPVPRGYNGEPVWENSSLNQDQQPVVGVTWYDAQAFAEWVGGSLPTEAQWERAARGKNGAKYPWGNESPRRQLANFAKRQPSTTPGGQFPLGDTDTCISDLSGNVWEWCEDDFHPLDGFKIHPIYDDFSTPCFDGLHNMILGGSFVSTGDEASMWARFHFRPHFHQHAGFRLAISDNNTFSSHRTKINSLTNKTKTDYESNNVLAQYLALHYSRNLSQKNILTDSAIKFDFPQKCAELLVKYCQKLHVETNSVADIGCAVGGTSFELARNFCQVIGIDLSKKFVEVASHLKNNGTYNFDLPIEGDICEQVEAIVDSSIDRTRVQFKQADACALPPDLVGFDAALLINLICRLPSPKACLNRLSGPFGLIRPGGLVLIATPFTWNEEYTPKEVWLGGYQLKNQAIDSREGLMKQMKGNGFTLVHEEDSVLLIREHRRKYQYILPNLTLWKRDK